jgi:hypothetical protein
MGPTLGFMGKQYKDVYPKNKNLAMRSIGESIKTYFLLLSLLVGVKLVIEAFLGMVNNNKKR